MGHHRLPGGNDSASNAQQSSRTQNNAKEINQNNNNDKNNKPANGRNRNKTNTTKTFFKLKPHQKYMQNQKILEDMFTNKYYKKFFTIKSANGESLSRINVIKASKQLKQTIKGKPKKVIELYNGNLLVEVSDEDQSREIKTIKKLDGISVIVEEHATLNQIKGTIKYLNHPGYDTDTILEELRPQGVSHVYQTQKRAKNGQLENSDIYLLTFDLCTLPKIVEVGWTRCEVREHIPRPRRCFECQKFGHGKNTCRNPIPICENCGQDRHGDGCDRDLECSNCGEPHRASSRNCFYYHMEQETLKAQTREKISYMEAKRATKERLLNLNVSYAQIASEKPAPTRRPQPHLGRTAPTGATENPTRDQEPQINQRRNTPLRETEEQATTTIQEVQTQQRKTAPTEETEKPTLIQKSQVQQRTTALTKEAEKQQQQLNTAEQQKVLPKTNNEKQKEIIPKQINAPTKEAGKQQQHLNTAEQQKALPKTNNEKQKEIIPKQINITVNKQPENNKQTIQPTN